MNYWQAILLGVIEGTTEYLPISSTFHLIWGAKLLGLVQSDFQKMFEVVIQSGAILAVIVLYLKQLNFALAKKVMVSFIPTAVVGFGLYKIIKGFFFENFVLQMAVFIGVGIFFIIFEKYFKNQNRTISKISYKEALMVGLAQALAVVPGVSRAGAVIVALLFMGIKRDEAAKYSFLLAVPTILAASALDLLKSRAIVLDHSGLLLVGLVVSFLSAYIVVKWFIQYLSKHDLSAFGWYRLVFGVILLYVLR